MSDRRRPADWKPAVASGLTSVEPVEESGRGGWRRARGAQRSKVPAEVLIRRLRDDGWDALITPSVSEPYVAAQRLPRADY